MEPINNKRRQKNPGGRYVDTVSAKDVIQRDPDDIFNDEGFEANGNLYQSIYADGAGDSTFESFDIAPNPDTTGADEELRIEALKQAVNIARLMTDVTVDDIINIGKTVYDYLK